MLITLILGVLCVFLAGLESVGRFKNGLKVAFVLIFIFLALRYDFGNDYMGYLHSFQEITDPGVADFLVFVKPKYEIGWVFLNHLFAPFGFFVMTGFLACITCIVFYRFIKKYVPSQYYWLAVFIYIFQPYNMLVLSSGMRQAVAATIFIIAIDFLIKRKIGYYLVLIFFATLFHSSAYLLIPFVILGIFNWRPNIITLSAILLIFFIPLIWGDFVLEKINTFTSSYFPYYEHYKGQAELNTGLGFILTLFLLLVTSYFAPKMIEENLLFFRIALISFLIIPLSFNISIITRFNFYLQLAFMVVYPMIVISIYKSWPRLVFISIICLFTGYQFFAFFQSEVWHKSFGVYHTIFTAPAFY